MLKKVKRYFKEKESATLERRYKIGIDVTIGWCQDIIIPAWEALPEGNYTPAQIENWLVNEMAPAINHLREIKSEDITRND